MVVHFEPLKGYDFAQVDPRYGHMCVVLWLAVQTAVVSSVCLSCACALRPLQSAGPPRGLKSKVDVCKGGARFVNYEYTDKSRKSQSRSRPAQNAEPSQTHSTLTSHASHTSNLASLVSALRLGLGPCWCECRVVRAWCTLRRSEEPEPGGGAASLVCARNSSKRAANGRPPTRRSLGSPRALFLDHEVAESAAHACVRGRSSIAAAARLA